MELKEIKLRNKKIREIYFGKNRDGSEKLVDYHEFQLMREVLSSQKKRNFYNGLLRRYPYIFKFEYLERIEGVKMKGDLLFTDGNKNFLVVECKSIRYKKRNERRRGRRKLEEQVLMMMKILKISLDTYHSIIGIGVTDVQHPFYIQISYRFVDDDYIDLELPNPHTIEKNPILALQDYCRYNEILEPEFVNGDGLMQVKILLKDKEFIGRSHYSKYSERYNQLNAACRLCKKLNIPYDGAIIYYL